MADTGGKFIKRNRPPRVHITYEDPYDAEKNVELPFVMGVLADLSGNDSGAEKPEIAERKFTEFDMDNFDQRMAAIDPGVAFRVESKLGGASGGTGEGADGKLAVDLHFRRMEDFGPAAIARGVPALAALLEAREQLANLLRYMDGKVAATDQIKQLLKDPHLMERLRDRAGAAAEPAPEPAPPSPGSDA